MGTPADRLSRWEDVLAWVMVRHALSLPLLAALGCSSISPNPDEAGVTTDPSDSADGNTSMSEETGAMDESTSASDSVGESESESGFKLDVAPQQDLPMPECWMTWLTEEEANAAAQPDCSFGPFDPGFPVDYYEVCVELPPDGDCASICPPNALCEGMEVCYGLGWLQMCGPYESVDSCCLLLATSAPVTTD
jgi:hypothetical protein